MLGPKVPIGDYKVCLTMGDAKPTDGAYQVYAELLKELEGHLAKLKLLIESEMPK